MRSALAQRLAAAAVAREAAALTRTRSQIERVGPGLRVQLDGQALINFSSNDYLGFGHQTHSLTAQASASASPLVSGHTPAHVELEAALCDFTGFEACCLFPSGYQANLAVGQALAEAGDHALVDRLNHASLNDGLRLSGARIKRYRHADADHARAQCTEKTRLLVSDSVFSMDGDLAPLPELVELADEKNLGLWIDDAHGFGVIGANGRGILETFNLTPRRLDVYVITFGKALGAGGAMVAGDRALIEHLENSARGLIYSTALAPVLAELTLSNLRRLIREPERRQRLHQHIDRFKTRCHKLGVELLDSTSAIQIIPIGDNARALAWSKALQDAGLLVKAIRPPTVPEGTARLRVTLSAAHSPQDIEQLLDALSRCVDNAHRLPA